MSDAARWLIVVQREEEDLYAHLARRFRDVSFVEVMRDRRHGERRRSGGAADPEQRIGDRRRPPGVKEREQWRLFGYRMVDRAEPVASTASPGDPSPCPPDPRVAAPDAARAR